MTSTPPDEADSQRDDADRERRLNLALAASRLHVWTYDVGSRRISVTQVLCTALDLDIRQCARPGWWRRRINVEDRERVERAFRECLAGGDDLDVEFRVSLANGKIAWFALRATLIPDGPAGAHLYGVCADISGRRADEERLRDSEHQLRTINDAIPVGIARCSRDGRFLFMNRAYAQGVLASPAGEFVDRPIAEAIGEAAAAVRAPHVERVLTGERVELTTAIDFKGVGRRMVHLRMVPEISPRGDVTGWIEVLNDITERERVEGRLHQREREFKTLVENAPDIIARLDRNLRYLYINRAIESTLDMNPASFVGRTGAELGLPASMLAAISNAAHAALSSGCEQPAGFELELNDQSRYFTARMIPEFDASDRVESVLMVIYDVTERMQAQQERERLHAAECAARERAEAAANARDQFLAIVSHELRSPLNGIQNWTQVLQGQMAAEASAPMWRALAGIKNGVDQQVRLIEDLLDAARILSGKLSLVRRIVRIRPVVENAIASVGAAAAARRIQIATAITVEDEQVYGDPDRLQQIVWNLLSNALKFTEPGGHVRILLDRQQSWACLRVADDGVGVSADFLPHMFDWFGRAETSSQRGKDGLGLGLVLVKHLCTLHGGQISANSAGAGQGASFEVRLPLVDPATAALLPPPTDSAAPASEFPSLEGVGVIVIDDQEDALEALSALLVGMQARVRTFTTGSAFIDWAHQQVPPMDADVVLCDIAMPGQDGYSTLAALRQLEQARGIPERDRLRVIALTAFAQREVRQRTLEAGFTLHLVKPVSADELAKAIREIVVG